jgi:hypothetical protein
MAVLKEQLIMKTKNGVIHKMVLIIIRMDKNLLLTVVILIIVIQLYHHLNLTKFYFLFQFYSFLLFSK